MAKKQSGKYVVIGLGRFGFSVAQTLVESGADVLAIDEDEERVQEVSDQLPNVVAASGADERTLRGLGVGKADTAIVSCGQSLEDSILSTAVLSAIGVENIVCKAISKVHGDILSRVGATRVVYPEHEMGRRLAESLVNPNVLEHLRLGRDYSIIEILAPKSLVGETLVSSNLRQNFGINVMAVSRDAAKSGDKGPEFIIPGPDYRFRKGDDLIIMGRDAQIEAFRNHLDRNK